MKKILSIMLCILMAFSCCSCSSSNKTFSEYSSLNLTEQEKSELKNNVLYLKAEKLYSTGINRSSIREGKNIDELLSESEILETVYVTTTFISEIFHKTKQYKHSSENFVQVNKLSPYVSYSWFDDVSRVHGLNVDGTYYKVIDKIYIVEWPFTYMCVYRTEAGDFYKVRDSKSILTHDEYVNMYRALKDEYDKLAEEMNLQEGDVIVGFNDTVVDPEDFAKNDITVIRVPSVSTICIIALIVVLTTVVLTVVFVKKSKKKKLLNKQ